MSSLSRFIRYIFFKDDFLVEVDGDSVTSVVPGSCSSDGIGCPSGSSNSFISQIEDGEGSGGGESRERACDSCALSQL
jgi:hypothetical protein